MWGRFAALGISRMIKLNFTDKMQGDSSCYRVSKCRTPASSECRLLTVELCMGMYLFTLHYSLGNRPFWVTSRFIT